jgi:hypothetical protein
MFILEAQALDVPVVACENGAMRKAVAKDRLALRICGRRRLIE